VFALCSFYYNVFESFRLTNAKMGLHDRGVKKALLGEAYGSAQAKPL
jgi:hypothetical protein